MMHLTLCPTGDTLIAGPNTTRQRNKWVFWSRLANSERNAFVWYRIVWWAELSYNEEVFGSVTNDYTFPPSNGTSVTYYKSIKSNNK